MTDVQKNTIANYAGSAWSALMGLLLVPLYLKFMGIESYGLVGFYFALEAVVAPLDLGLSTTLNRELAFLTARDEPARKRRDLVRTLEIIYAGIGLLLAIGVISCSGWLAENWVQARQLPVESVSRAIALMGIVLAFQWPLALYGGGLKGLQRQVLWNAVLVVGATIRGVGSVLVLWLVSPTVEAFFLWQAVACGLQTAAMALALWGSLPGSRRRSRFQLGRMRGIWNFTVGVTGIGLAAALLAQVDKVVLSKVLSLEAFGYYTLAWTVASVLFYAVMPVTTSVFPRFSELVSQRDDIGLRDLYHKGCQMVTVFTVPVTALISLFAVELISLWTGNRVAGENAGPILSLLAVGVALNSQMMIPGVLQLAHGWTRLLLALNAVTLLVMIPLLVWIAGLYGALGVAALWIFVNAARTFIGVPLMHIRLLHRELATWFLRDLALPTIVGSVLILGGWWLMPASMSKMGLAAYAMAVLAAGMGGALLAAPLIRHEAVSFAKIWRRK
jgi:O-antigen/teichoic acid export membrane protein